MNRVICILILALALTSCKNEEQGLSTELINIAPNANNNRSSENLPEIEFALETYDFGKVIEGQIIEYQYKFTNTGNADLIISDVQTSCGCTTAKDWSQKPYQPGESGSLTIIFDSDKKAGTNNKTITVLCNTVPSVHKLQLKGEVVGPK